MMKANHAACLIAALVLGWSLSHAQDPEDTETGPVAVGLEYLELYHAGKIEELRPFYTAVSIVEDPTARAVGAAFRVTGGDAIVTKLSELFAAVGNPVFTPAHEFQSGGFAVSAGVFAYDVPGLGEESVRVELQVATIVELDGDKVVHHADYANYDALLAGLKEQRERDR